MSDKSKTSKALLQRAYDLKSEQDTRDLYRDWATTYDQTMVDELTYSSPSTVAALLAEQVKDKSGLVADFGCGTGLTGQAAFDLGFTQLVGLDFSDEMLVVAKKRGIYTELRNVDLTTKLDIETGCYDAAISSGIFTYGHLNADCLSEIFRTIKVGGVFVCVVRLQVWNELGFAEEFARMVGNGEIERLEARKDCGYQSSKEPDGWFLAYRKL